MKLPRRRVEAWLNALEKARVTTERLARSLGRVTAILYGSYARGDFNVWSDIDLIVASEAFEGTRFLDRYDVVSKHVEPGVEAVLLTPRELVDALGKPAWRQALAAGSALLRDDYELGRLIEEALGAKLASYEELVRRVRRLLEEAIDL